MLESENLKLDLNKFTIESKKTFKPFNYETLEIIGMNVQYDVIKKILAYCLNPNVLNIMPDAKKHKNLVRLPFKKFTG